MRIARRAVGESTQVPITGLAVVLVVLAWVFINGWYLVWGIWLIPYRCCAGVRASASWRLCAIAS